VDQLDLKVGQAVQPGMQGIRIVNLSKLKVEANIPESYTNKLDQGDRVTVIIPDAGDSVETTLTYVSKVIDPASRSFKVEVRLPEKKYLKPNMTAVLNIIDIQKNNSIVLPIKAIQKSEQGEYVYVVENNKAKRIEIKIGATYRGRTQVLTGLPPESKVIVDGAQNLEEGDAVQVI
jgi:RND family efflux transporter MFP subunit